MGQDLHGWDEHNAHACWAHALQNEQKLHEKTRRVIAQACAALSEIAMESDDETARRIRAAMALFNI